MLSTNIYWPLLAGMGFPDVSVVKNQLAMQKTQVESLGREDPLEEEMATHSRIIAWEELSWWPSESAFHVGDAGSIPDQRTKIPHAVGLLSVCSGALMPERKRTLVFLPEKSLRQRSPEGYSPWGHNESHMT